MHPIKNILQKGIFIVFLLLMFAAPAATLTGAKTGLLLWFNTILPTLLPFIILSNIIIFLNITDYICYIFSPILKRVFRISSSGCYPIIIGLLSGFPIGAKSTADLVRRQKISLEEGQFLVSLCNNASITFITSYIAMHSLNMEERQHIILGIIFLSAIISSVLSRLMERGRKQHHKSLCMETKNLPMPQPEQTPGLPNNQRQQGSTFEIIDRSILDGFEVITKVGGYIILFSICGQILLDLLPSIPFVKIILVGILEITTGIRMISSSSLSPYLKFIIITAVTAFGGLSSYAQTNSVMAGSGLSSIKYLKSKILNAAIACTLSILYVRFFMY